MKQRVVALVSQYLEQRVRGRIVQLRPCGEDDLIIAVEDVRDGRVHLLHSLADLEEWLMSFKEGRCLQSAAAICDVCDSLHIDCGLDGEFSEYCAQCRLELIEINAEARGRQAGT
jgi:hypothetical protein